MELTHTGFWIAGSSATLTKETGTPYEGARVLRVARNGDNDPYATQTVMLLGKAYRLRGRCRSDGNATPRVLDGTTVRFTGTTSTDWQAFDIVMSTPTVGTFRLQAQTSTGVQYCEFDAVTVEEIDPMTATLAGSGGSLNRQGNAYWRKKARLEGAAYINAYSHELNSLFPFDEGAFVFIGNMDDFPSTTQRFMFIIGNSVTRSCYSLTKSPTAFNCGLQRRNFDQVAVSVPATTRTRFAKPGLRLWSCDYSVSGAFMRLYFDGILHGDGGAIPAMDTGMALGTGAALIGTRQTTPEFPMLGDFGGLYWFDQPMGENWHRELAYRLGVA